MGLPQSQEPSVHLRRAGAPRVAARPPAQRDGALPPQGHVRIPSPTQQTRAAPFARARSRSGNDGGLPLVSCSVAAETETCLVLRSTRPGVESANNAAFRLEHETSPFCKAEPVSLKHLCCQAYSPACATDCETCWTPCSSLPRSNRNACTDRRATRGHPSVQAGDFFPRRQIFAPVPAERSLPSAFRLPLSVFPRRISKVPFLKEADNCFISSLVMELMPVQASPGDFLMIAGEVGMVTAAPPLPACAGLLKSSHSQRPQTRTQTATRSRARATRLVLARKAAVNAVACGAAGACTARPSVHVY
eukprot:6199334-Pleurochrysis_carterae.AAC.6